MKWIKASKKHPPNWFTAKLRNIEQGCVIGPYPVKAVYKTAVEFDTPGVKSITYISNIEWLYETKRKSQSKVESPYKYASNIAEAEMYKDKCRQP